MNEQERTVIPEEARRLLIVDDDADMLKLLAKMLGKHCQCEIMLASSADAALSMLEQSPPAVVLSDIRMPGMDGLSFFEQINRHVPTITTILMSGYGTIEMAVQVRNRVEPALLDQGIDAAGHDGLAGRETPVVCLADGKCLGCHGRLLEDGGARAPHRGGWTPLGG